MGDKGDMYDIWFELFLFFGEYNSNSGGKFFERVKCWVRGLDDSDEDDIGLDNDF